MQYQTKQALLEANSTPAKNGFEWSRGVAALTNFFHDNWFEGLQGDIGCNYLYRSTECDVMW